MLRQGTISNRARLGPLGYIDALVLFGGDRWRSYFGGGSCPPTVITEAAFESFPYSSNAQRAD